MRDAGGVTCHVTYIHTCCLLLQSVPVDLGTRGERWHRLVAAVGTCRSAYTGGKMAQTGGCSQYL